jgi:endonuclease/exonuclease/phosphatase family metal-dependent hydrolase
MAIRILSWNIFWGLGVPASKTHHLFYGMSYFRSRRDRKMIPRIAAAIRKLSPDIVALQEADGGSARNGRYDHAAEVSRIAELPHFHFAAEKAVGKYLGDGNALLSRFPFARVGDRDLPYKIEKRNYVSAKLEIRGRMILVITTHLGAHSFNGAERMMQVKRLSAVIRKSPLPVILAGDFNCDPGSEEFRHLVSRTGLRPLISEPTFPVYAPRKRYDNILVRGLKVRKAAIIKVKLSDHYPVYAELE